MDCVERALRYSNTGNESFGCMFSFLLLTSWLLHYQKEKDAIGGPTKHWGGGFDVVTNECEA